MCSTEKKRSLKCLSRHEIGGKRQIPNPGWITSRIVYSGIDFHKVPIGMPLPDTLGIAFSAKIMTESIICRTDVKLINTLVPSTFVADFLCTGLNEILNQNLATYTTTVTVSPGREVDSLSFSHLLASGSPTSTI